MIDEDALEELLAKQAIAERLADYARGADRVDIELVKSVFHPEARADYGDMFQGTGHEFAEFLGVVHPGMETHHHQLGQVLVRVDGDRAGSETYVIARLRHRQDDGTFGELISYGRYLDRWERRDGEWRISDRRYVQHLDESWSSGGSSFATLGARDATDPSYDVLALRDPEAPDHHEEPS